MDVANTAEAKMDYDRPTGKVNQVIEPGPAAGPTTRDSVISEGGGFPIASRVCFSYFVADAAAG
jgi:hypothetical protein